MDGPWTWRLAAVALLKISGIYSSSAHERTKLRTYFRILHHPPFWVLALTEKVGDELVGLRRGIDIKVVEPVCMQSACSADGVEVSEFGLEAHEVTSERLGCWFMVEGLLECGEGGYVFTTQAGEPLQLMSPNSSTDCAWKPTCPRSASTICTTAPPPSSSRPDTT